MSRWLNLLESNFRANEIMEDLEKKIPYSLTLTLNKFNELLTPFKKDVIMEAAPSNSATQKQITISYRFRNTDFYFHIYFTLVSDLIYWQYYPYSNTSTKPTSVAQSSSNSSTIYKSLSDTLILWKKLCEDFRSIENPIKFFQIDDYIKFYADEILVELPENETDSKLPLSSLKQSMAIKLLNLQIQFLDTEINGIEDLKSEKYKDLFFAKKLLEKIKEDLPRTTTSDVKKNWIISLACIKKWCFDKFLAFLSADKNSHYDLSRTLGSFIGGIFNIPKLES